MTFDEARILLGIHPQMERPIHPDHVRAAYAGRVKDEHPDTGGEAAKRPDFKALKAARDFLLADGESMYGTKPATPPPRHCNICGGTGWVRTGGFKQERCPRGC